MRKGWSHYTRKLLALTLNVINDHKNKGVYFSPFRAVEAWDSGYQLWSLLDCVQSSASFLTTCDLVKFHRLCRQVSYLLHGNDNSTFSLEDNWTNLGKAQSTRLGKGSIKVRCHDCCYCNYYYFLGQLSPYLRPGWSECWCRSTGSHPSECNSAGPTCRRFRPVGAEGPGTLGSW